MGYDSLMCFYYVRMWLLAEHQTSWISNLKCFVWVKETEAPTDVKGLLSDSI